VLADALYGERSSRSPDPDGPPELRESRGDASGVAAIHRVQNGLPEAGKRDEVYVTVGEPERCRKHYEATTAVGRALSTRAPA